MTGLLRQQGGPLPQQTSAAPGPGSPPVAIRAGSTAHPGAARLSALHPATLSSERPAALFARVAARVPVVVP